MREERNESLDFSFFCMDNPHPCTWTDQCQNQTTRTNRRQWGLSALVDAPTPECGSKPQNFPCSRSMLSGLYLTWWSPITQAPQELLPPLYFLKSLTHITSISAGTALPLQGTKLKDAGFSVLVENQRSAFKLEIVLLPSSSPQDSPFNTHPYTNPGFLLIFLLFPCPVTPPPRK